VGVSPPVVVAQAAARIPATDAELLMRLLLAVERLERYLRAGGRRDRAAEAIERIEGMLGEILPPPRT
jgi:hypothetical protein